MWVSPIKVMHTWNIKCTQMHVQNPTFQIDVNPVGRNPVILDSTQAVGGRPQVQFKNIFKNHNNDSFKEFLNNV